MLPNLDRRRLFPGLTTAPCIGIAGFILQTDTNEKEQDHAAIFNLARRKMNALVYRGWVLLPSKKSLQTRTAIVAFWLRFFDCRLDAMQWPG